MKEFIVQIDETKVPVEFIEQMQIRWTELIRCKDCKHRPSESGTNHDLEFPDYFCPCQNTEDDWYSWMPDDGWFCPDGERKKE